jgi:hypothetical protein
VSEVKRSSVFLNLKNREHPAALIVYDRITSTDADSKKTWLLHSINEPDVSNSMTTITRIEDGYNGKLVNHTLLPQNAEIVKIGGPGYEFWVDGKNIHRRRDIMNQAHGASSYFPEVPARPTTF